MPKPTVHPALAAHAAQFSRRVVKSGSMTYTYQGYNIASVSVIDAPDGLILVDCAAQEDNAKEIAADIAKQFDKPIKSVVYTHFHNDHVNGVEGFVSAEDVAAGKVSIWSHDALLGFVTSVSAGLGPIMGRRASYTFGAALPRGDDGFVHAGLGLPHNPGPRGFIAPTHTITERSKLFLCGLELELIPIPSETDDMIGVWLESERILLSGDCIQGNVFPNLYTLRGTPYRDPMQWVQTIDWILTELQPEIVVTHHAGPLIGRAEVDDVLTAYRDAIQFTHDQTVRFINRGWNAAAIAEKLKLPPHLATHPWLGEFYGALKHCIPAIYAGKIGWFSGDPIELDPLPRQDRARRYIALAGGHEQIVQVIRQALEEKEFIWALELAAYLVSDQPDNSVYKALKAQCLRDWAYQQSNANWRNWGLSCAMELDPPTEKPGAVKQLLMAPPGVVNELPVASILKSMTTRLIAEACFDVHIVVAFSVVSSTDVPDQSSACRSYALEIRRGVCQFHESLASSVDAELTFPRTFVTDLVLQKDRWPDAIKAQRVVVDGDTAAVERFFKYFEPPQ